MARTFEIVFTFCRMHSKIKLFRSLYYFISFLLNRLKQSVITFLKICRVSLRADRRPDHRHSRLFGSPRDGVGEVRIVGKGVDFVVWFDGTERTAVADAVDGIRPRGSCRTRLQYKTFGCKCKSEFSRWTFRNWRWWKYMSITHQNPSKICGLVCEWMWVTECVNIWMEMLMAAPAPNFVPVPIYLLIHWPTQGHSSGPNKKNQPAAQIAAELHNIIPINAPDEFNVILPYSGQQRTSLTSHPNLINIHLTSWLFIWPHKYSFDLMIIHLNPCVQTISQANRCYTHLLARTNENQPWLSVSVTKDSGVRHLCGSTPT